MAPLGFPQCLYLLPHSPTRMMLKRARLRGRLPLLTTSVTHRSALEAVGKMGPFPAPQRAVTILSPPQRQTAPLLSHHTALSAGLAQAST